MTLPIPQDTGSTTIEAESEGVANGVLSLISEWREIEYDEEEEVYRIGGPKDPLGV